MTSPAASASSGESGARDSGARDSRSAVLSAALDGAGGARIDPLTDEAAWRKAAGPAWAIVGTAVDPARADARRWLTASTGLPAAECAALFAETRRSWVSTSGDILFGVIQTLPDERSPGWVRLVRTPDRLVTITPDHLPAIDAALEQLRAGRGARTLPELAVGIAAIALERVSTRAHALDAAAADLEYQLDADSGPAPLDDLRTLQKKATYLRRLLARHREALERLDDVNADNGASPGGEQERWRRIRRAADDCGDLIDGIIERLRAADDYIQNHLSAVLNDRLYVLTLVSAIALPLSFVTELLGVNVGGVPLRDKAWGFPLLCAFLVALAFLQYTIIRRLRWLPRQSGGPRPR